MYKVYFDQNNQKVRWTQTATDKFKYEYKGLNGIINGQ